MFFFVAGGLFSQDELAQRGSIPEELLRPRREESPRYPTDTVIGTLGRGSAPAGAYECAKRAAAALLAATVDAPVFSSADKVFIESCMNTMNVITPRIFRLGSGRTEPDGSVSFLVRFIGREMGITGELFVRLEPQQPAAAPPPAPVSAPPDAGENEQPEAEADKEVVAPPVVPVAPVNRVWIFEDIILEEPRSREAENAASRNRFDFTPYERIY